MFKSKTVSHTPPIVSDLFKSLMSNAFMIFSKGSEGNTMVPQ